MMTVTSLCLQTYLPDYSLNVAVGASSSVAPVLFQQHYPPAGAPLTQQLPPFNQQQGSTAGGGTSYIPQVAATPRHPVLCIFIISAIAGVLLKPQHVNFFFSKILVMILKNSDILFGSDYKREN